MRIWLLSALLVIGPGPGSAQTCKLSWPNPEIAVPGDVRVFIAAECRAARGSSEESEAECVAAEAFGYRAQVTMLMDEEIGEAAADRYRACGGGMGTIGGRYHRRRADCMGGALEIAWRFEFTREAAVKTGRTVDFAATAAEVLPGRM